MPSRRRAVNRRLPPAPAAESLCHHPFEVLVDGTRVCVRTACETAELRASVLVGERLVLRLLHAAEEPQGGLRDLTHGLNSGLRFVVVEHGALDDGRFLAKERRSRVPA